jgi:hypothetical protein
MLVHVLWYSMRVVLLDARRPVGGAGIMCEAIDVADVTGVVVGCQRHWKLPTPWSPHT